MCQGKLCVFLQQLSCKGGTVQLGYRKRETGENWTNSWAVRGLGPKETGHFISIDGDSASVHTILNPMEYEYSVSHFALYWSKARGCFCSDVEWIFGARGKYRRLYLMGVRICWNLCLPQLIEQLIPVNFQCQPRASDGVQLLTKPFAPSW